MTQSVMGKIEELSKEKEKLISREGTHHESAEDHRRLEQIDHDLQVLWDLRRRELAGDEVDLKEDFLDRYDRYTDRDSPGY